MTSTAYTVAIFGSSCKITQLSRASFGIERTVIIIFFWGILDKPNYPGAQNFNSMLATEAISARLGTVACLTLITELPRRSTDILGR